MFEEAGETPTALTERIEEGRVIQSHLFAHLHGLAHPGANPSLFEIANAIQDWDRGCRSMASVILGEQLYQAASASAAEHDASSCALELISIRKELLQSLRPFANVDSAEIELVLGGVQYSVCVIYWKKYKLTHVTELREILNVGKLIREQFRHDSDRLDSVLNELVHQTEGEAETLDGQVTMALLQFLGRHDMLSQLPEEERSEIKRDVLSFPLRTWHAVAIMARDPQELADIERKLRGLGVCR